MISNGDDQPIARRSPQVQSNESKLLESLRKAMLPSPPPTLTKNIPSHRPATSHSAPLIPQKPEKASTSVHTRPSILRDYEAAVHSNLVRDAYKRLAGDTEKTSRAVLGPPAFNSPQEKSARSSVLFPSILRNPRPHSSVSRFPPGTYSKESTEFASLFHKNDSEHWRSGTRYEERANVIFTPKPPTHTPSSIDTFQSRLDLAIETLQADEDELRVILLKREQFELEILTHLISLSLDFDVIRPQLESVMEAERAGRAHIHTAFATAFSVLREQQSRMRAGLTVRALVLPDAERREDDGSAESIIRRLSKQPFAREKASSVRNTRVPSGVVSSSNQSAKLLALDGSDHFQPTAEDISPLLVSESVARAYIVGEQSTHFQVLFADRWDASFAEVKALDNRKAHLNRLQQWRGEREQKHRRATLAIAIRESCAKAEFDEREIRKFIVFEEDDAFHDDIVPTERAGFQWLCRAQLEDAEAKARSTGVIASYWDDLSVVVEANEELSREWLCTYYYEKYVSQPIEGSFESLSDLLRVDCLQRASVIVVQRVFRKIRLGLGGWRRTHRRLGGEILQMRSLKAMRRAQAPLLELRNRLYEEGWDLTEDVYLAAEKSVNALITEEAGIRSAVIEHDEAWARQRIEGHILTNIMFRIMVPRRRQLCDEIEPAARHAIRVGHFENGLWGPLYSVFLRRTSIIGQKESLELNEVPTTFECLHLEEEHLRGTLRVSFLFEREAVSRRQEVHDSEQAASRLFVEEQEQRRRSLLISEESILLNQHIGELNEHFFMDAMNTSLVCSILQPSLQQFVDLFVGFAVTSHTLFELEMFHTYFQGVLWAKIDSLSEGIEPHLRSSIEIEEHAAWQHFQHVFVPESLFDLFQQLIVRDKAAKIIQKLYRDVRVGGLVGRSGMRAHLASVFQPKRDRLAFYRHMDIQRENLDDLKAVLAQEITNHICETAKEFSIITERLESVESRCRVRIEEDAIFMLQLIETNSHSMARDTVLQQLRDLRQQESYWRHRVEDECQRSFDTHFKPKKATFQEDVRIRPAQRAWRCFKARKVYREKVITGLSTVQVTESYQRAEIAKEALITLSIGSDYVPKTHSPAAVAKRSNWAPVAHELPSNGGISTLYWSEFMMISMTALLNHECFSVCFSQLVEDETVSRLGILSTMQGAIRVGEIEEEERLERAALYRNLWDFMLDELELSETERCEREAIEHEYFAMILKCVVSQSERERASLIYKEYTIAYVRDICCFEGEVMIRGAFEQQESAERRNIVFQTCVGVLDRIAVDESTLRSKLQLEFLEESVRIPLENQRDSLENFFLRLINVQEMQQRFWLYKEEVAQVELDILLPWRELYGRYLLERRWATTGPFKEEDLDFGTL